MPSDISVMQGLPRYSKKILARSVIRKVFSKVLDATVITQVELIVLNFRLLIVFCADYK